MLQPEKTESGTSFGPAPNAQGAHNGLRCGFGYTMLAGRFVNDAGEVVMIKTWCSRDAAAATPARVIPPIAE